jgi:hypothetical protein
LAAPAHRKLGDCKCLVRILIRSRPSPRARWVARSACAWDHPGCICDFAAAAGMSVAATTRPTVMPGITLKRPGIRLSRATTLPRDGAGATSMTSKSSSQAGRRTTVQSRASSEREFDRSHVPTALTGKHHAIDLADFEIGRAQVRGCLRDQGRLPYTLLALPSRAARFTVSPITVKMLAVPASRSIRPSPGSRSETETGRSVD